MVIAYVNCRMIAIIKISTGTCLRMLTNYAFPTYMSVRMPPSGNFIGISDDSRITLLVHTTDNYESCTKVCSADVRWVCQFISDDKCTYRNGNGYISIMDMKCKTSATQLLPGIVRRWDSRPYIIEGPYAYCIINSNICVYE